MSPYGLSGMEPFQNPSAGSGTPALTQASQQNTSGFPPGSSWDPAAYSVGLKQPPTIPFQPGVKGNWWLTSQAPQRLDEFRRFAEPLVTESTRGAYLSASELIASQNRESQRQAGDQYAAMGMSPAAYFGNVAPAQNQGIAEQLAGLRGQAIAGEAQGQMDLRAQILSALNQVEAFYDSMKFQNELAADQRAAARAAGKSGMLSTGLGALGAIGASSFGYGGAFGQSLGAGGGFNPMLFGGF